MPIENRPLGLQDSNYSVDQNIYSDEEFRGEYTGTNLIYKGFARPGGNVNEPVWQIAFLTYDGSNNVLSVQWPLSVINNGNLIPNSETIGTVTTPWTSFSGNISNLPVAKGTVVIKVGNVTYTDVNKNGTLTGTPGTNSGTINYDSGAITLTINPALVANTNVDVVYNTYPLGNASNDYQFIWSERHSYTYV